MTWEDPMTKEYGPHELPEGTTGDFTVDCIHGCGYSIGPSRSGGAVTGDNLLSTKCPNNPVNGNRLGDERDKFAVLAQVALKNERWAMKMEHLAAEANARLGQGTIYIAEHRDKLLREGNRVNDLLGKIALDAEKRIDLSPPEPQVPDV